MKRLCRLAAPAAAAGLAACTVFAPPPPAPAPSDACGALNESLAAAVPPGESLADLQARGVRVRTPLSFPPGSAPRASQSGGAVVRLMIQPDGSVAPGSPRTVKSVGEAQIAAATEAAALSMSFDFDAGTRPAGPIPFTTVYAACARS
ncbi:hypothetical protein [Piscinibacter sp. XHJ-5]|uniref:hypothetical protein n=1 Tax=Piscinibacter sp. XHJ-5 TaxID=3037797 RepID=UPI002453011B|nr:hypothetical protein [Piscinibacter sp. XHJ-5]